MVLLFILVSSACIRYNIGEFLACRLVDIRNFDRYTRMHHNKLYNYPLKVC
jgi:hypothetical protein